MSRWSENELAEDIESGLHINREVIYETAGSNRAMRRHGHKKGYFVPSSTNRPAVLQKDGSYLPLTDGEE